MALIPGARLGVYEVTAQIGEGGMGRVYGALDTKLQRKVALKVLPPAFATDAERLERFTREALMLAALNHPHIAALYGLEEGPVGVGGQVGPFLVMELVEGPTLEDVIDGSKFSVPASGKSQGARARSHQGLPVDEALRLARQIAEALEAAHEQGIVHRDLKPANIKVRADGQVKVLDFGLAKALDRSGESGGQARPDLSASPTITSPAQMTAPGVILGTAAYMSPEQARGRTVDTRTDIWAFGAVLFEMLAGRKAFDGETVTDVLAGVVGKEPDWRLLPTVTPDAVRRLLQRALHKDMRKRLQHIGDARVELDDVLSSVGSGDSTPVGLPSPRTFSLPRWAMAAIAAAAFGGLAVGVFRPWLRPTAPAARDIIRSVIKAEGSLAPRDRELTASPDGRRVVYAANGRLYVRELNELASRPIPGTDGAHGPFFSPAGDWVGFFSGNLLKKVGLRGEPAETVASTANGQHGTWSEDGFMYFARGGQTGLFRVQQTGGVPGAVTTLGQDGDHNYPMALPGGKAILFGVYHVGDPSWEDATIEVQSVATGDRKVLIRGGTNARYLRTGHLLYHRRGALLIAPFDLERLEVTGPSRTVHDGVLRDPLGQHSLFDVSPSGTLVYVEADASLGSSTLVLVDRSGAETPLSIEPGSYSEPRFSPRGTRIAVTIGQGRVGIYDLARGTTILLGAGGPTQRRPIWMPDGERVVAAAVLGGGLDGLSLYRADGTGQPQLVVQGAQPLFVTSDGKDLIYRAVVESQGLKVFVAPIDGHSPPKPLRLGESVSETGAALSPNGRYIAYTVDESGGSKVYVRPFPNTEGGRWLVGAGIGPVWGPDSRELFFSDVTGQALFRVGVLADTRDAFSRPERAIDAAAYTLVETRNAYEGGLANFDVSPDGTRFLMVKRASSAGRGAPNEIVLVQNWLEELSSGEASGTGPNGVR